MRESCRASSDGLCTGVCHSIWASPAKTSTPIAEQDQPAPAGIGVLGHDLAQECRRQGEQLHECQRQEDADERREPRLR